MRLLPWLFVVFAVAGISVGIRTLAGQPQGKETLPAAATRDPSSNGGSRSELTDARNDKEDPVKDLQRKIDELKWILGVILGAAGLFTIAQGAAAFFTAQAFVKQADEAVKRVEEVASDAERRYPVFSKAEEARRDAYRALAATFYGDWSDWRDALYDQMSVYDRQRLFSIERFIGIEFVGWAEGDPDFSANLRRLANFYASKYVSEGQVHKGDRERSEYYLGLAGRVTKDQFWILNDLGVLFLELHQPRKIPEAKKLFEQSYAQNPRQQRPLYNLAVIATYGKPPDWVESARLCETALQERLWERTEAPEMTGNVYYNLACARARLNQVDECLNALEDAARVGRVKKEAVDADADQPSGDLYGIAASGERTVKDRFEALRGKLSQHANSRRDHQLAVPAGVKERLSKAWDVLLGRA